jgi:pimeloyl-ACP methyl ester carboxylesterase
LNNFAFTLYIPVSFKIKEAVVSRILLIFAGIFILSTLSQGQNTIEGDWLGTLKVGNAELRLVFHIYKDDAGKLTGTMDSPDQGATGISATGVNFTDNKITVTMGTIGGQYEGNVNMEFTKIDGTWSQGGRSFPIVLEHPMIKESAAPKLSDEDLKTIKGIWQGTLSISGVELRLVFKIDTDEQGALMATMDSPDQGATDIPVSSVDFRSDSLFVKVGSIGGKYVGRMSDPEMIEGTWFQSGQSWSLNLKKVEKEVEINRPQTPKKPYPYHEEELSFHNPDADIDLAGTLTIPEGTGPFPAAIMISGSGPQDRDETIFQHKPFLVIADYLTRSGIAVLRYDDRGTAKSGGSFANATSEDFATDAESAFEYLKTRSMINPKKIGLIGHSEGGLIAPMIAAKNPEVAFVIMIAGPSLPGKDILLLQSDLIFRGNGTSDSLMKKILPYSEKTYEIATTEKNDSVATQRIDTLGKKFWDGLTEQEQDQLKKLGASIENIEMQTQQILSPWFRYFLSYDPAEALKNTRCPVLAIYGGKDLQVPANEDIRKLEKITAGKTNFTIVSLPGLDHLMQTADKGLPSEYGKIEETIAPVALTTMGDWLKKVL